MSTSSGVSPAQRAILRLMWEGVGPARLRELLEQHGSAEAVLAAGPRAWWAGVVRRGRLEPPPVLLDEELRLIEHHGVQLITVADAGYPASLRPLHDPPPALYIRGTWLPEDGAAIGIVGSRAASIHGAQVAEHLAYTLASHGITIVSGLARGIDGAAHRGALKAGGRTLAILGTGLLKTYPEEHAELAGQIAAHGALISEFPMLMDSFKGNFPRRNRIIAGLSLGVVVVEAAAHSGALITANYALEQGREVFAVPGPAGAATSRGTHQLLRDGARLVETAEDVLTALKGPLATCIKGLVRPTRSDEGSAPAPRLTADEDAVYARLTTRPVGVDQLTGQTGVAAPRLLRVLLGLELRGLVRQVPGQQFVRVAS